MVMQVPLMENLVHTLDLYNDAAHRALYGLKKQFLYNEIEAEVNLVVDQFTYLVADDLYGYCKNIAASVTLDKVGSGWMPIQNDSIEYEISNWSLLHESFCCH